MNMAELIFQEAKELPEDLGREVLELIRQLRARHAQEYERAKQQALTLLEHPPFSLNGCYESRDSLYDRR